MTCTIAQTCTGCPEEDFCPTNNKHGQYPGEVPVKSKGHIGFDFASKTEFFLKEGCIQSASFSNCIDAFDGYRVGSRFECYPMRMRWYLSGRYPDIVYKLE